MIATSSTATVVKGKPDTEEGIYRPINLQEFGCKLVVLAKNDIGLFELSRKWAEDGTETSESDN
jgi:hypothetical protein